MSDATKIDRDALAEVLFYAARRDDWGVANDDEREEFYDQADAVIAHLSAVPVEGDREALREAVGAALTPPVTESEES